MSTDDITAYPHLSEPASDGPCAPDRHPFGDDFGDDLDPVDTTSDVEDDLTDEDDLDEGVDIDRYPGEDIDDLADGIDGDLDDPVEDEDEDEDDPDEVDARTAGPGQDPTDDRTPDDGDGERRRHSFADLGVRSDIVVSLERVGITHPFPIQAMALPVAMSGHDIIGQAKTGTGKTLGFGIPLLQQVSGPGEPGWDGLACPGKPQALVVVPTRELAVQVAGDLNTVAWKSTARVLTVYGGRAYEPQIQALDRGIEIVVGTPGRLLDLAQQGHLDLGHCRVVVLDEADEMLDLGFLPDVERLLGMTPTDRQMMLFSATMPGPVVALARRFMTQPTHIRAADPDDTGATVKATAQFVYRAHALDKVEMLARILQARDRGLTIVFARTKRTAARVAEDLDERGFAAAAIHGDLGQGAREQALRAFRKGKIDVLVATDVAARGIDVDDVTHVVNYQCPEDEKTYLHRIGRTGRAGNTGTAITFVDWDEVTRWSMIDKSLDLGIPEAVETYSSSPHLYTDLEIPTEVTGRLPESARTRAGLDAEAVEDLGETGRARRGERDRGAGGRSGRNGRSGGRSGGGRGRGERRPSGNRDGDTRAGEDDVPRQRRPRQRRRTRGGRLVGPDGTVLEGAAAGSDHGDGKSQDPVASGVVADGTGTPSRTEPSSGRRRSRSRSRGSVPAVSGSEALFLPPDVTPAPGHGDGPDGGDHGPVSTGAQDGTPRRRRRRGGRGRSGGNRASGTGSTDT